MASVVPASAQSLVNTNASITGTINGGNGPGYYVTGGATLTVNNASLQNFTTTGGSGSGGGAGFGGAIFIDTGAAAVLNGASFSHDTAIGGVGGTNSPTGGTLNNGVVNGYFSPTSNGIAGTTPPAPQDNSVVFGNGFGSGINGVSGTPGGNASRGFGGAGGTGLSGTPGWSSNPIAINNYELAVEGEALAADNTAVAGLGILQAATFVAAFDALTAAAAAGANAGGPTTINLVPGFAATDIGAVGDDATYLALAVSAALGVTISTQALVQASTILADWNAACANGTLCFGGNGGNGGPGGAGSSGFGGGAGGNGVVGADAGTIGALEGNSGNGGAGGAGGFGGGGGAGGFGAGASGDSNAGIAGVGGAGGAAGFGGGVGSTGGIVGGQLASGCAGVEAPQCSSIPGPAGSPAFGGGGGSGYGGAIFVNAGGALTITGTGTFAGDNAIGGASLNGGLAGGAAGTDLFMMTGATVIIAPGAAANVPNVITFNGSIADNSSASIGTSTAAETAGYPIGAGAGPTIYAGLTVFNGQDTYSGQTVINGGALDGTPNTATNTTGPPNYATTDGALQAADGIGLPTTSNLNFAGPSQFVGGVLQTSGTFNRWLNPNPNPYGNGNPGGVQWLGSGGFAAINAPLTVTLDAGEPLTWNASGFVPFGFSLMFGSANSTNTVTFTNPIDISGGTASILVANNGNAAGSMATMSGVISSNSAPGTLSVGGGGFTGTLNLTGANTYTGGTSVNQATLGINNGAALGTGALALNNGTLSALAGLTITQPVTLTGIDMINTNGFTVAISGNVGDGTAGPSGTPPGTLVILGPGTGGTVNLTGTVSYTGGTVLAPGTSLTASGTASAGINAGPIVVVSASGATDLFTGTAHVVGPLDVVDGATPELIILPGDTLEGVGSVNLPVVIQGGGANAPGDGAGTLVFTAPVTDLAGSTYTIAIDGPLASASNCPNPPNTNGCAGQYSSTVVTGAGNTYTAAGTIAPMLTGITAPANNTYIPPAGTGFTVVYAPAGVLGSFSALTQPAAGVVGISGGLAPGTRFDALYFNAASALNLGAVPYASNPTAINLWVTPANYQNLSYWNVALNANQSQVAGALNALRGAAGVKNNTEATWDFGNLFPQQPQALPGIFSTLSGEVNADAPWGAFRMMTSFLGLMVDPSVNGRAGVAGGISPIGYASDDALNYISDDQDLLPPDVALAYNVALKAPPPAAFNQRWSAWGSGFGEYNNTNSDPSTGTTSVTASAYGFAAGMDYHFTPDTLAGFALAGGGTNWGLAQGLGSGRSDAFQAGLYATTHFGPAYFSAALAFANHWMSTSRTAFGGDQLDASFDAQDYGARIEAGYRYAVLSTIGVTPYVAGTAQGFHAPNYSETDLSGGGFGLSYNAATTTDISSELGARFDTLKIFDGMPLMLRGRVAWEHDWTNNAALAATFQAAQLPGAPPGAPVAFQVNGAGLPANSALASASAELRVTRWLSLLAKLDSEFAGSSQTYAGTATVRVSW